MNKILTIEEIYAIPIDGNGWSLLPNGNKLMVGANIKAPYGINSASIGAWARIGDSASIKMSPLAVQGTRHLVTQHSKGKIAVGCEIHTHEEWLRNYVEIGERNDYTPEQIEEYGRILRFVIDNGVKIGTVKPKE